ncbi:MAG TPA: hypothetical protein VNZ45_12855 [Bacteroidia bacterium]|nr:hypothetical protein [Bacteroidia bacterium]
MYKEINNQIWSILFVIENISQEDRKAIVEHGEPIINLGGVFLENTADQFILPELNKGIRTGFPYKQTFDGRVIDNIQFKIENYLEIIVSRITDAMATLRSISDTFSGEEVFSLNIVNPTISWVISEQHIVTDNDTIVTSYPIYGNNVAIYSNGLRQTTDAYSIVKPSEIFLVDQDLIGSIILIDYLTLATI